MLRVSGLEKSFRNRGRGRSDTVALDGVDIDVEHGSFAAILGPSGSGKTTLLRCIAGFERPDEGTITLSDRILDAPGGPHIAAHDRRIGIVPQEAALFPHLNVAKNIGFGLTGMSRPQRAERVRTLLELVDLEGLGDRRPHQLSGGQQQRVALARALAPEPGLILLDEPFSALDAKLRVELRDEIRSLLSRLGTTAILVTHDQDEALALADHLVVLRDGRVVATGHPYEIYECPPDLETARFLGRASVLRAEVEIGPQGPVAVCELGRVPIQDGSTPGRCDLMIRPEQLCLTLATGGRDDGTVETISYLGSTALITVKLTSGTTVMVSVDGHLRPRCGDAVRIEVMRPLRAYPVST